MVTVVCNPDKPLAVAFTPVVGLLTVVSRLVISEALVVISVPCWVTVVDKLDKPLAVTFTPVVGSFTVVSKEVISEALVAVVCCKVVIFELFDPTVVFRLVICEV